MDRRASGKQRDIDDIAFYSTGELEFKRSYPLGA